MCVGWGLAMRKVSQRLVLGGSLVGGKRAASHCRGVRYKPVQISK